MISTNQFKNGITIQFDNKIYQIISFQHIKPGKGGAFVRTKLRDLKYDSVIDRTFRSGEKFETAYIEQKRIQYLYHSGSEYFFMDTDTYEQVHITKSALGDATKFLKDGMTIQASFCDEMIIGVNLPISIELKITHTEPGLRGDTARAAYKPATVESGAIVQVPLFINENEIIRVDTRTGKYLGRA